MSWSVIFWTLEILGVLSAIRAIYYAHNANGAIAWAISLITFPYLALPLYWTLSSRSFHSYSKRRRMKNASFRKQYDKYSIIRKKYDITNECDDRLKLFSNISGGQVLGNNFSDIIIDAKETYEVMFEKIHKAQSYILAQFFIIENDSFSEKFIDLLCQKARDGVQTYLLFDAIGSNDFKKSWISKLDESGVNTGIFAIMKSTFNPYQINFRNHRKLLIVDGINSFIGGINIGKSYLGQNKKIGRWRDTMLHLKGPCVLECQTLFYEDWYWATDKIPALPWQINEQHSYQTKTIILGTGPADKFQVMGPAITALVNSAKDRLWLTTPYFIPDDTLVGALKLAVKRGVDVRLLFPRHSDHLFVWLASHIYLYSVIKEGVVVYFYEEGFMHQKVILVDNDLSMLGSANLDSRSLFLNFEISAICQDKALSKKIEKMLIEDFKRSKKLSIFYFTTKSWMFQFGCRFSYLFSSVL